MMIQPSVLFYVLIYVLADSYQQEAEVCYDADCISAAEEIFSCVNFTLDPCNNFHQYACSKWIAQNPIPPSKSYIWRLGEIEEHVYNVTRVILTERENQEDPIPLNLARQFYQECMNIGKINSHGVEPLKTFLHMNFHSWQMLNSSEWSEVNFNLGDQISTFNNLFMTSPILSIKVDTNLKVSTKPYLITIDQPTLGLPGSILLAPENFTQIIQSYKTFIVELAIALGSVESKDYLESAAIDIIQFETKLANITRPANLMYDPTITYNPFTVEDFQSFVDSTDSTFGIEWENFLSDVVSHSGIEIRPNQSLMVLGKDYIEKLIPILLSTPSEVMSNYIQVHAAVYLSKFSTTTLREIKFNFTKVLSGQKVPPTLERNCLTLALGSGYDTTFQNNFAMAISYKFIRDYVDKSLKPSAEMMYKDIADAFAEMLLQTDWMDSQTKSEALGKIEFGKAYIGYPEWIINKAAIESYYEGLKLPSGHLEGMMSLEKWANVKRFKKIGHHPTEQNEWLEFPTYVGASYWPTKNAIYVPAAILQSSAFNSNRPAYMNYPALGQILGHEIIHGFDEQGSKYDKYGNAVDWWQSTTLEEFTNRGRCMIDQYSKYFMPTVGMFVNGELTLGENIADNGGIIAALRAYQKYVDRLGKPEPRLPGLEEFTPEQNFFISNAIGNWCDNSTDEFKVQLLLSDPHSPLETRTNQVLRNLPEFSSAFNCPVGSPMNPLMKCKVWA